MDTVEEILLFVLTKLKYYSKVQYTIILRFYIYLIYISYLSFVIGNNVKYCVFGDGIFHPLVAADSCIRLYHREAEGIPMTALQIAREQSNEKSQGVD